MVAIDPHLVYASGFTATGLTAGVTDWKTSRIPNLLTFPAILAGLAAHAFFGGWHGLATAALAVAVMFVLVLPFVLQRSMGMGDYKLLLAVSSFAGLDRFLWVLAFSAVAAGFLAIAIAARSGRLGRTLRNLPHVFDHLARSPFKPDEEVNIDNPGVLKLPFGVAVALGCIATVLCSGLAAR